jgi:hypothetical protein
VIKVHCAHLAIALGAGADAGAVLALLHQVQWGGERHGTYRPGRRGGEREPHWPGQRGPCLMIRLHDRRGRLDQGDRREGAVFRRRWHLEISGCDRRRQIAILVGIGRITSKIRG